MTGCGGSLRRPLRSASESSLALIERLRELPADGVRELLAESERAGSRIVRRLVDEFAERTNRFDAPGEALFGAWMAGRLVGVCGLNIDPYARDPRVGRVRHLYVLTPLRGRGIGRQLVGRVIEAAEDRFDTLRLRTRNPEAARLYELLGFEAHAAAEYTHVMVLAPGPSGAHTGV